MLLAALLIVLATGCVLLWREFQGRATERRMLAVITGASEVEATVVDNGRSSIRNVHVSRGRLTLLLIRALGIKPDVKGMNLVPWPSVLVVALPASYGIFVGATILVARPTALLIGLVGGFVLARGAYAWQADRYRQKLFGQMPDVIELVISAISAGMPVGAAFAQVARDVSAPTSDEFARVMADIAVGRPIDQAIMRIFERTGVSEYAILATTVGLQSDTGGRIAESIENLARIIRERHAVAARAQARASESKLSGNILAVMPVVFGVMMSFVHPGYLDVFVTDPSATRLIVIAVVMLVFGILLMRFIIRWSLSD